MSLASRERAFCVSRMSWHQEDPYADHLLHLRKRVRIELPSWKTLSSLHSSSQSKLILKDLFDSDSERFDKYSTIYNAKTAKGEEVEILLDYSKNLIDEDVWKALISLAQEASESLVAIRGGRGRVVHTTIQEGCAIDVAQEQR